MSWSKKFPKEPGFYWFYGYESRYDRKKGRRHLSIVEVKLTGKDLDVPVYIAHGSFLYPGDGVGGDWLLLPTPELPEEEED